MITMVSVRQVMEDLLRNNGHVPLTQVVKNIKETNPCLHPIRARELGTEYAVCLILKQCGSLYPEELHLELEKLIGSVEPDSFNDLLVTTGQDGLTRYKDHKYHLIVA